MKMPSTRNDPASPHGAARKPLRVLVVDDEPDIRRGLRLLMQNAGMEVIEASSGQEALQHLGCKPVDLVLTDLMMPGMSGTELLAELRRRYPSVPVVLLTAFGTIQTAVQCLLHGAAHFLTKPFDNDEIVRVVRRLGEQLLAERQSGAAAGIVAEDPRTLRLLDLVARVARSPLPVLIEGESGTGKEIIARRLHAQSLVAQRPFLAVNTAALTETLLESELFGHRKGSFTGADRDRRGLFEEASGGTVFLDEIASMPASFQGKLLRVLQEKTVRPVGGSSDVAVDFRLIAATNKDLAAMVKEGTFRDDLFYRLRVVSVRVPPLRERPSDIVPLARHFLAKSAAMCGAQGDGVPQLGSAAVEALQEHPWPGNVRELENAMARAVLLCGGGHILPHHLGLEDETWAESGASTDAEAGYAEAKKRVLERFQREFALRALERTNGNVSQAATDCGLTRAAFQRILRSQGIDRRDFGRA